jgi:hypothetical protein
MLGKGGLELVQDIPTGLAGDNIAYDMDDDRMYIGGVARIMDVIGFVSTYGTDFGWTRDRKYFPGGAGELARGEDGSWMYTGLILNNELYAASAALLTGQTVIIGSWFDEGWLKCSLPPTESETK